MIKKIFISSLVTIFIIAIILTVSVKLTDYKKISQSFVQGEQLDISLMNETDVTVKIFPLPYLLIEKAELNKKIAVKNAKIHFSIISLLTFNPQVTSLEIGEVIVHLEHNDIKITNHDELVAELISQNMPYTQANIDKITFIESDGDIPLIIENFNFTSRGNEVHFVGRMDKIGELNGSFKKSAEDVSFKLAVNDKDYKLNLEENYKNNQLEKGKFTIETSKLAHHIYKLIPTFAEFSKKLNSKEKTLVEFDIAPTKTHMNFDNLTIISNSLNGAGQMHFSKNTIDNSAIKLEFTKIDLSKLLSFKQDEAEENKIRSISNQGFDFNTNPMKIDISIKDSRLGSNNVFSNVYVKALIEKGRLYLQDFSGKIDQDGNFKINGVVTKNSFRSVFKGKIDLKHKNLNNLVEYIGGKDLRTSAQIPFILSSDIELSSLDFSLHNFVLKTNETDIMGNISTKYIANALRSNATIKFSAIDLDKGDFPIMSQALNYTMDLFNGMKNDAYLGKFIPLRKLNTRVNYDISVDKLIASKKTYKDINFNLDLSPGKMSFKQFSIHQGDNWLDGNITLDARKMKPRIDLSVQDGSMAVDFLTPSSILDLRNKILDNFDLSKIDIVMNFALKKLQQGAVSFKNLLFKAETNKDLLNITQFESGWLGGTIKSSGSILLNPYTLNFVYALSNAQVSEAAKLLPKNMLKSGGVFSASGMWSTHGNKLNEQLYNLYTNSNVLAKDITVQNISIDDFIEEVGAENYNIAELQKSAKNAILTKETKISEFKTSLGLTKGMVNLPSMAFKTKHSTASGAALFNLYNFELDASAIFSFKLEKEGHYFAKPSYGYDRTNQDPATITLTGKGSLFSLKKTADTTKIEGMIKARNAATVNPPINNRSSSGYYQ